VDVLGHSITPEAGNAPFDSREGLLFVGAVYDDLSPNADSLIWFLSQVLPRIRSRLGDIPVTIRWSQSIQTGSGAGDSARASCRTSSITG
jgi:hypothetical protein